MCEFISERDYLDAMQQKKLIKTKTNRNNYVEIDLSALIACSSKLNSLTSLVAEYSSSSTEESLLKSKIKALEIELRDYRLQSYSLSSHIKNIVSNSNNIALIVKIQSMIRRFSAKVIFLFNLFNSNDKKYLLFI